MKRIHQTSDGASGAGRARALAALLVLAAVGSPGFSGSSNGSETPPPGKTPATGEFEPCVEESLARFADLFTEGPPPELTSAETRCFVNDHPVFYLYPKSRERMEIQVADVLLIREMDGKAVFSLEVQASYGHSCHVWGVAARAADGYLFEEPLDGVVPGSEPCRLRLAVRGATAEVEDLGNRCRRHCGNRAVIGHLEFEERLQDGSS